MSIAPNGVEGPLDYDKMVEAFEEALATNPVAAQQMFYLVLANLKRHREKLGFERAH